MDAEEHRPDPEHERLAHFGQKCLARLDAMEEEKQELLLANSQLKSKTLYILIGSQVLFYRFDCV